MTRVRILALLLLLLVPVSASPQTTPQADPFVRMGTYVASDDLARSEAFYSELFARVPALRLDDFVAFDVAGGWFAIVSRTRYAADAVPGSGAVPYIQTLDLEGLRNRAVGLPGADVSDIIVEPGISLFKIVDPDGQLIEFYAL